MVALSLRRRVALWLCPEITALPLVVKAGGDVVSARTEHVIRLGRIFLASHDAPNFWVALGFKRRRSIPAWHPEWTQIDPLHQQSARLWIEWSSLVARPPKRGVTDKTYDRLTQFFSDHWPEGAPWPSDIPRPAKSKGVA